MEMTMNNIVGTEKYNTKKYNSQYCGKRAKVLKMLGLEPKDIKKQRK